MEISLFYGLQLLYCNASIWEDGEEEKEDDDDDDDDDEEIGGNLGE